MWTDWSSAPKGAVTAPTGRSLQWELELSRNSSVERIEVAHRELNMAPRITEVEVLDPGEVYLSGPPPSGQFVDVSHPDVNGLFTVLGDEKNDNGAESRRKGKKYWRVGYRSVSWDADDPNNDPLRFELSLEDEHGRRFPVRERLEGTILAVDVTAVPDGRYRFRVTADDEAGNPGGGLESHALSRWFLVDSTPPTVRVERTGDGWTVTATDDGSGIARAEVARDGRRWTGLVPRDGLFDGNSETFHVPAADGGTYVVVRVVDRHHNRMTKGISEE
jgi:hypothetical protein